MQHMKARLFGHCMKVITYNKIDATHLIHELHAVRQQHTPASLHLIPLQQLRPTVLSMFSLDFERLKDFIFFLANLGIVRRQVVDFAKDLQCLGVLAVRIKVSRRFGQSKDQDYDSLRHFISETRWELDEK